MDLKPTIKKYWEDKQPAKWYSKKEYGTKEYYDDVEYKRYNSYYPYLPIVSEFDLHKGHKVLEIGVALGTDLKQYAQGGAICYGIDLTESSIKETRNFLETYGLNANLQVMDAENLQFDDNTFDLVYSFGVLHHTPDTQKTIDEIYRVLKPKGRVIIMLYSKSWQHYIIRVGFIGIWYGELKRMSKLSLYPMKELINKYSEAYGNSPLTKLYNKKQVKEFFKNFKEIEIKHYHYKNNFFQYKSGYYMGNWVIKGNKLIEEKVVSEILNVTLEQNH